MLVSIFPSDIIPELDKSPLRFLRLPHPRTNAPALFLPHYSTNSLLEVQILAPHTQRSWLTNENNILSDGKLLFMTPIDPVLLLIPLITALELSDRSTNFRPIEDIFEDLSAKICQDGVYHSNDIVDLGNLRCVKEAFLKLAEHKVISEELTVYRTSREKLLHALSLKLLYLSRSTTFESHQDLQRHLVHHALLSEKEELQQACRIRTSREVLSQYIPEHLLEKITPHYESTMLDEHIQRRAAEYLPTASSEITHKPVKGPKTEDKENTKRKAASQLSKGVTKLMKANTNGMSKISSFFAAKPAK